MGWPVLYLVVIHIITHASGQGVAYWGSVLVLPCGGCTSRWWPWSRLGGGGWGMRDANLVVGRVKG